LTLYLATLLSLFILTVVLVAYFMFSIYMIMPANGQFKLLSSLDAFSFFLLPEVFLL
jgi:hypothetical protein